MDLGFSDWTKGSTTNAPPGWSIADPSRGVTPSPGGGGVQRGRSPETQSLTTKRVGRAAPLFFCHRKSGAAENLESQAARLRAGTGRREPGARQHGGRGLVTFRRVGDDPLDVQMGEGVLQKSAD